MARSAFKPPCCSLSRVSLPQTPGPAQTCPEADFTVGTLPIRGGWIWKNAARELEPVCRDQSWHSCVSTSLCCSCTVTQQGSAWPQTPIKAKGNLNLSGFAGGSGNLDTMKGPAKGWSSKPTPLVGFTFQTAKMWVWGKMQVTGDTHGVVLSLHIPASDLIPALKRFAVRRCRFDSHAPTCLMTKVLFSEPSKGL